MLSTQKDAWGKGISGISGMEIKQEIKKEMAISSLDIQATDAAIAISSLYKGLEIQIWSYTEGSKK